MRIDRFKLTVIMMKKNLTQKKLAEMAGVSKNTVGFIKSGKSCTSEVGQAIANALGVDVEELLEKENE